MYGFPAVDFANYGNEYNAALMNIVGTITEGDAIYNYAKTRHRARAGTPIKRDYRWSEYEFYAQDTWRVTSALTLTYGLRYSYLQAPAETSGTQVGTCQFSGSVCQPYSLTRYYQGSVAQADSGGAANTVGEVAFNLNGRYNHAPDFWTPEKKDFGPRLAVAFSPAPAEGAWRRLLGNQQTSIRAGYSLVFDHFGAATVQNLRHYRFLRTFFASCRTRPVRKPLRAAPRFTGIHDVPQSLLPSAPAGGFPAVPASSGNGSFAISWGLDSAIKTPYSHLLDFSITRGLHNGGSLEVSWIGRLAHRQLAQEDVAMPLNLNVGGTSYFAVASQMAKLARANTPVSAVAPVPYWQQEFAALDGQDIGLGLRPAVGHAECLRALSEQSLQRNVRALSARHTRLAAQQQHRRGRQLSRFSLLPRPVFGALFMAFGRLLQLQRARSRLPPTFRRACRPTSITRSRSRSTSLRRRNVSATPQLPTTRRS